MGKDNAITDDIEMITPRFFDNANATQTQCLESRKDNNTQHSWARDDTQEENKASILMRKSKWRKDVRNSVLLTGSILLINVVVLIWASTKSKPSGSISDPEGSLSDSGRRILSLGSCSTSSNAVVLTHLFINILSTLLLAASTLCMQILVSPTRDEVNMAHKKGTWLDIGIPSLRNLSHIGWRRLIIWTSIAFASIPIHLFYNSIFYQSSTSQLYDAILVNQNFIQGNPWKETADNIRSCLNPAQFEEQGQSNEAACAFQGYNGLKNPALGISDIASIQKDVSTLTRLDTPTCFDTFTSQQLHDYKGVLLVSLEYQSDNSILQFYYGSQGGGCSGGCDLEQITNRNNSWEIAIPSDANNPSGPTSQVSIDHCLAIPVAEACTFNLNRDLLIVVVVFNLVKLISFILLFWVCNTPMVTVGDAVASFLETADNTTENAGPVSARDIRRGHSKAVLAKGSYSRTLGIGGRSYNYVDKRWYNGASLRLWLAVIFVCVAIWICGLVLLASSRAIETVGFEAAIKTGLNPLPNLYQVGQSYLPGSEAGVVLIVNLPQLAISSAYVLYNGLITSMLASSEYSDFGKDRKPLRVSDQRGQQRQTYWLSLPFVYSIPFMIIMALLHWLVSESLFYAKLNVVSYFGDNTGTPVDGAGYSPLALLLTLIVGAILVFALICLGFRKLKPGVPIFASNSMAISSACHRATYESSTMSTEPLQYGVLRDRGPNGRRRVAFSASDVDRLVEHDVYE